MSDVRSRGSSGSRVSFNPHVAIATHNYQGMLTEIDCISVAPCGMTSVSEATPNEPISSPMIRLQLSGNRDWESVHW